MSAAFTRIQQQARIPRVARGGTAAAVGAAKRARTARRFVLLELALEARCASTRPARGSGVAR